jgi:alginate export protein
MRRSPLVAITHVARGAAAALAIAATAAAGDDAPQPRSPSWLQTSAEYRLRVESVEGARFQPANDDAYALNRLRFGITLQPQQSWRAVVQLQDARVFLNQQAPRRAPFQDVIDARLAYVDIGSSAPTGLSLRAGRQELVFGDQRLIGNADWLNTGRTFDAVRASWRRERWSLDTFAGFSVSVRPDRFNRPEPGSLLSGVDVMLPALVPAFRVEAYFFGRRAPNQAIETGPAAVLHSGTTGLRWRSAFHSPIDTGGEMAGQFGSAGGDAVRAWAGHWDIGYRVTESGWQPRLTSEYNYASGDHDPHDGRRGTFDQLYPTGHDKHGLADQVGWRNVHDVREGVELRVTPRWQTRARYTSWWLASTADALYDAAGAIVARSTSPAVPRHVGQELDVQATFTGPHRMNVAAGYAHIFPGAFLDAVTAGRSYSYPFVSFGLSF